MGRDHGDREVVRCSRRFTPVGAAVPRPGQNGAVNPLLSLRRVWSDSTLVRVGLVLSVVALLALSIIVAATVFTEQSTGKASAINMAGSLRMQSYALSTLVADTRGGAEERRQAAEAAINEFDRRLKSPSLMSGIPADGANPVHRIYSGIVIDWETRIKPLARSAVDDEEARAQFLGVIPAFVDKVDILVRQIETDLESRIQRLRMVLGIGFFVMMMLVVAALFLLNIEVFQPIARLADDAKRLRMGDFRVRAGSTGPDEIGQLGQAFNFMVEDLSRLYGSLEKQVAEKTRDLERRNESLALLYETTRTLAGKPVDAESLQHVLAMVRRALGVESGVICSIHGDSTRGMPLARDETTVKACGGADCRNCADGAKVTWRTEPGAAGERRILGIPLIDGGVSYGVMPLVLAPGKGLEVWQLELAETMGRHIGAALAAAERRDEHRRLGVLEERAAIARELHDSLAQSLSYTKIQIARLAAHVEREESGVESAAVLAELREGINSAYRELRELLTTFRLGLGDEGFAGALRDTLAEFERRSGVRSALVNDLLRVELSANEQVHVLQIVREALTNIEHHARARHAWVSLQRGQGQAIDVSIEDDGVGIRNTQSPRGHFGLSIMRDRAQSVGGELVIERREPTGTRVRLTFVAQTAFGPSRGHANSTSGVGTPQ
jgi:two-component system nitrate/nitrite sensor histidine kinase NarX